MIMEKIFDVVVVEVCIYEVWEMLGVFKVGVNVLCDEIFIIMLLLFNVIGVLYVGYVFNYIIMDILMCWKWMQGYDILWQFGQDYVGIVIQLQVEKKLMVEEGKKCIDLSCDDFLLCVWDWKI